MRILVTGARGFVGKNLVANLMNVKEGKDRNRNFVVDEVYSYDIDTDPVLLEEYCQKADFVFHLAGVNRPKDQSEFMEGNFGFSSTLLEKLKAANNSCPVMLSSSVQATLIGRYGTSDYGKSKLAGEELFFQYAKETESGADQITIVRWQHFVIILPMICQFKSMTARQNWNCSILMIW